MVTWWRTGSKYPEIWPHTASHLFTSRLIRLSQKFPGHRGFDRRGQREEIQRRRGKAHWLMWNLCDFFSGSYWYCMQVQTEKTRGAICVLDTLILGCICGISYKWKPEWNLDSKSPRILVSQERRLKRFRDLTSRKRKDGSLWYGHWCQSWFVTLW